MSSILNTQSCRVAVVTGAGSGVGKAVALALLADGYCVVLAGRRIEPLQQVADLSSAGDRALVWPTDVSDEANVCALFDQAVRQFGRVDLLFNNAGISAPAVLLEDLSLAQWQSVVNVNLTGMFLCLRQAFRVMKVQTPRKVGASSTMGPYRPPRLAPTRLPTVLPNTASQG
jgi:NAD(P)-dependent dehydrogenase (short-subunit alcohol dehydrogenase family)